MLLGLPHSSVEIAITWSPMGPQACQNAIAQATHVVFFGDVVPQHEDGDATSGGRQGGVHRDLSRQGTGAGVVHAQGAAGVEAIPAEPQRKGAQP